MALSLCSAASFAWEPPVDKTVTAIVGFAPGSGNELTPTGFEKSMMALRKQWIPIIEKMDN